MIDVLNRGYLNSEQFKLFITFVFDINLRTRNGKDQSRRLVAKLGKNEFDTIEKDLLVDFIVEHGALELRKKTYDDDDNEQEADFEPTTSLLSAGSIDDDPTFFFNLVQRPATLSQANLDNQMSRQLSGRSSAFLPK